MDDDFEFIMLTSEKCPHCAHAKEILKDKIDSKKIKVVDISKDEMGKQLVKQHNIKEIPTVILKVKTVGTSEACDLKADLTGLLCKDKEVDF